jgi:hypothetical protein
MVIWVLLTACGGGTGDEPGGTGSEGGPGADGETDPCDTLAPDPSPAVNLASIQDCLDRHGSAHLQPGTYAIDGTLSLPSGAVLAGLGATRPLIQRVAGAAGNTLLSFGGDRARATGLDLDGNSAFTGTCCDSIVGMSGNDNTLEESRVFNNQLPPPGLHPVGVYVICPDCTGNVVRDVEIFNSFYGVILRPGRPADGVQPNTIDGADIHDNKCDSVTFIGHGAVIGSDIHDNGWDCENGPIPGGGIYTLRNDQGGVIRGNRVHDNCGNGLDLVESSGFDIEDNHVYDPGNRFGGAFPYCSGIAVAFFTMSHSTLRNNTIENNDRPWNTVTPPAWIDWFRPAGGVPWSDLPGGTAAVLGFLLVRDPGSPYDAIGNNIDGNRMRASCSGGCVGVGYFTSRGTGLVGGDWSASTTNYFTGNDPFGSNVGSWRCGGNWYAASSTCGAGSGAPCNGDDYQHTATDLRNDDCRDY